MINEKLIELEFNSLKKEVNGLKKYWEYLDWIEKKYILDWIFTSEFITITYNNLSENSKLKYKNLIEDINILLSKYNECKPNKCQNYIDFILKRNVYDKNNGKYNLRYALSILSSLSKEELNILDEYLDIQKITKMYGQNLNTYKNLGENCSMSYFYAFRNFLSKYS